MTAGTRRSSSAQPLSLPSPPVYVTEPDACTICGHDTWAMIGAEHCHPCCYLEADSHGRCQPCAISRQERRGKRRKRRT